MTCEEYVNEIVVPAFSKAEEEVTKAAKVAAKLAKVLRVMEEEFADVKIAKGEKTGDNFHPNRFSAMHDYAAEAYAALADARHKLTLAHREADRLCDAGGIIVTGGGGGK